MKRKLVARAKERGGERVSNANAIQPKPYDEIQFDSFTVTLP